MRHQRSDRPHHLIMRLGLPASLALAAILGGCSAMPRIELPSAFVSYAGAPSAQPGQPAQAQTPGTPAGPVVPDTKPAPAPVAAPDLNSLQREIAAYLDKQDGTWGAYVIDIASGKATGYNENQVFPTASTFKLPMAMYILDQVEQGKARLDELLTYSADDYEEGTGILQDSVTVGDQFSVNRLIELAITESDNIATNMLLRRFGRENVYAFMKNKLGGKVTQFPDPSYGTANGTTPKEMATYMRMAYGNKAITDPKLRQYLLDLLSHTAFDDRAAAGVPKGVKVAHKIGTLPNVCNDVALVYAPKRTFVVAVYSIDVNEETAPQVIADVTRKVYDFERDLAANSTQRSLDNGTGQKSK